MKSTLKTIFTVLLTIFVLGGAVYYFTGPVIIRDFEPLETMFAYTDFEGRCSSEIFLDEVEVYVVDGVEYDGQYFIDPPTIVLSNTGINTIAHEVSHYVDDLTYVHGISDGETRAYLQGYFTKCVYDLTR